MDLRRSYSGNVAEKPALLFFVQLQPPFSGHDDVEYAPASSIKIFETFRMAARHFALPQARQVHLYADTLLF